MLMQATVFTRFVLTEVITFSFTSSRPLELQRRCLVDHPVAYL